MKIVKDEKYDNMYRIQWPNGDLSDMYNLPRTKNHLRVLQEMRSSVQSRMPRKRPEKATDALF